MRDRALALFAGLLLAAALVLCVPSLKHDRRTVVRLGAADVAARVERRPEEPFIPPSPAEASRQAVEALGRRTEERPDRAERRVSGRILGPLRAPLSGATVSLGVGRGIERASGRVGYRERLEPARTDERGAFCFRGDWADGERFCLQVSHPLHAPAAFERWLPSIDRDLDFGELVLEEGGAIAGRVVDLEGLPVPGAAVRLESADGRARSPELYGRLPTSVADGSGGYELSHVPPGHWRVVAVSSEHLEARSPTFLVENGGRIELDGLELDPGFVLRGLVLDRSGRPVARAEVDLHPPRGASIGTRTDDAGCFTLERLPGAPSRLEVRAAGHVGSELRDLDPRSAPPWLTVTLADGLTITGSAVDAATGEPVERLAVHAVRIRGFRRGEERSLQRERAESPGTAGLVFGDDLGEAAYCAGGRFEQTGLDEGIYQVVLQSPGHTRWRSEELELRVGVEPVLAAALARGLTITGTVCDSRRLPVNEARVELHPAGPSGSLAAGFPVLRTKTDRAGRFTLAHAPPGNYRLSASAPRLSPARTDVLDLSADLAGLELELEELGTITGLVAGARDAGSAAMVVLLPIDGGQTASATTLEANGAFRLDLPAGSYAVRVTRAGAGGVLRTLGEDRREGGLQADVTVRSGETVRFDTQLMEDALDGLGR